MSKKEGFEYEIEIKNNFNYVLDIFLEIDNRFFKTIFDKSKPKLEKKGIDVKQGYDLVTDFDAPKMYYNMIRGFVRPLYKSVCGIMEKEDKLILKTDLIDSVKFSKIKDKWKVKIRFSGYYEKVR